MTAAKPEQDLEWLWEELTYTASNPIQGRQPFTYPELKDMFVRLVQAEVALGIEQFVEKQMMVPTEGMFSAGDLFIKREPLVQFWKDTIGQERFKAIQKRVPRPPQQPPTEGGSE